MKKSGKQSFPRWLFAIIAAGGLLASGIFLGIISVEGITTVRLVQAVAFGLLSIIMFWGAMQSR